MRYYPDTDIDPFGCQCTYKQSVRSVPDETMFPIEFAILTVLAWTKYTLLFNKYLNFIGVCQP